MSLTITTPRCQFCNLPSEVEMTDEEYAAMADPDRPSIQNVLPSWPASKRELLISGTHPECWDHFMKDIDDEPDGIEA